MRDHFEKNDAAYMPGCTVREKNACIYRQDCKIAHTRSEKERECVYVYVCVCMCVFLRVCARHIKAEQVI